MGEVTTAPAQVTPRRDGPAVVDAVRGAFPFRPVVLPWIVARLLTVPALAIANPGPGFQIDRLIWMDGQWFRLIALDFYDRPYIDGRWSEYPFFPLFPALGGVLMRMGFPPTLALAGVSWLAALVAMAGVHRLAVRHLPAGTAPWATWFLAIGPGALTMVLGYSDSLFLAGAVWALVLVEDRRWWAAGLLGAVATISRPNGFIAIAALVVAVLVARAGWRAVLAVALPGVVVLAAWCGYLSWATGDPLVFWSAKEAWSELTLGSVLGEPWRPRARAALFHIAWFLALAVPYVFRIRRQPPSWAVFALLGVLPPFVLGVEGLARYAVMAFPMPLAAADVVAGRSRWLGVAFLTAAGASMVYLAIMVVSRSWLP